jgi:hypothetical protein
MLTTIKSDPSLSAMKKIFLICTALFFVQCSRTQWEPDLRLTNDPSLSRTGYSPGAHSVASSGDSVYVVWTDNRDDFLEIYFQRSVDAGLTWENASRIVMGLADSPSIATEGATVHVAWRDFRDGNAEIYYKHSTDGGINWEPDIRLTNRPGGSFNPCLIVSGSMVHLVYYDYSDLRGEIYYMRSTNGGSSWEPEVRLTDNSSYSLYPSIGASGPVLHVTWRDNRDGNSEIYYKRSINAGISWGADVRLTQNDSVSESPCIGVSGNNVHVVWMDKRHGNYDIYYKSSTDGGVNWGADLGLNDNKGISRFSNMAVSGSGLFLVWEDDSDGNREIYYRHSANGGLNWDPELRLTHDTAESNQPSVSASRSQVNVVWQDKRDRNYEVYFKRNPKGL